MLFFIQFISYYPSNTDPFQPVYVTRYVSIYRKKPYTQINGERKMKPEQD